MRKVFLIGWMLLAGMTVQATVVHYTADDVSVFPNPERGFTDELGGETKLSDSNNHVVQAEADWFFEDENRADQTLVMLMYYLYNYKTTALSNAILQGFDEDMQILRDHGYKCVLRFAYDWQSKNDADTAYVHQHIQQLKPYLAANADVIYVLETGFVGRWGEWYYSSHFGNQTQQLNAKRRKVVEWMLDACPNNRFLLVRYPMIKAQFLGDTTPLGSEEAFSNTARARIGHHNDAFLNEWGNDGTYVSWDEEEDDSPEVRQYIADETKYVPNGGETNVEGSSLASVVAVYDTTMAELSRYHWSFCGQEYSEDVTDRWRANGTFAEMQRRLGYRYQLVSATLPETVPAGGQTSVSLQIRNTGCAPIYNERHAYLVLRNQYSVFRIQMETDPRRWLPNGVVTDIDETIEIPSDVPAGTYQLYLHLPDAAATLAEDPRYAVRFANTDVWDATTGMNRLNASVTVTEGKNALQEVKERRDTQAYDVLGRPVDGNYHGIVLQNGTKRIQ